jgi:hypothetical protein
VANLAHSIFIEMMTFQFGFLYLVVLSGIAWFIHFLLNIPLFALFMRRIGYPPTHSWLVAFVSPRLRNDRIVGRRWFVRQNYLSAVGIAILILFISYARAFYNLNAVEFARGGALIVIASLMVLLIDVHESRLIKADWDVISQSVNRTAYPDAHDLESPADKAHLRATWITVFISVLGTVIWAYGDQVLACWSFPRIHHVIDSSGVSCFQKPDTGQSGIDLHEALWNAKDSDFPPFLLSPQRAPMKLPPQVEAQIPAKHLALSPW